MTIRPRKPTGSKLAERRPKPPPRPAQRPLQTSVPEILTRFEPVGRETLAVIAAELLSGGTSPEVDDPELEIARASRPEEATVPAAPGTPAASRSALIQSNLEAARRERRRTVGYEEPTRVQGRATNPSHPKAEPKGRTTLDALEKKLSDWASAEQAAPAPPSELRRELDSEVFEMATFVVRGDLARLSSTKTRREFVAERLLHRLPVKTMAEVDRVDVTPWTVQGTVIVRVWCHVPPA